MAEQAEEINLGDREPDGSENGPSWIGKLIQFALALGVGVAIGAVLFGGGSKDQAPVSTPPLSASGGSTEDSSPGSSSGASETPESDCESKGISGQGGNEGTCVDRGVEVVVVNSNSVLKLRELNVELLDTEINKVASDSTLGSQRADGEFVTFRLEVKNKLNAPQFFDDLQDQVFLRLGQAFYTQDFDVQNGIIDDSFVWIQKEIQPQGTQTGTVTFDIPKSMISKVDTVGGLEIVNFTDQGANKPSQLGVIRTYD